MKWELFKQVLSCVKMLPCPCPLNILSYFKVFFMIESQFVLIEEGQYGGKYLTYSLEMEITNKNDSYSLDVGTWSTNNGFLKAPGYTHEKLKR